MLDKAVMRLWARLKYFRCGSKTIKNIYEAFYTKTSKHNGNKCLAKLWKLFIHLFWLNMHIYVCMMRDDVYLSINGRYVTLKISIWKVNVFACLIKGPSIEHGIHIFLKVESFNFSELSFRFI